MADPAGLPIAIELGQLSRGIFCIGCHLIAPSARLAAGLPTGIGRSGNHIQSESATGEFVLGCKCS